MSATVSGSQARPFPRVRKERKKPTGQCLSGRSRGPGSGHVVQPPRQTKTWSNVPKDLNLGAEHDRNQQGARSFLEMYSRAARGENSKHQHQHQHQQAKHQSASSPHSSRGPCLIFLGPQRRILQHRHRGHVAGPLSVCPAYWPPCPGAAAASTPRRSSPAHHLHTAQRPRRLSATLQRIAMGLDAQAPLGLECDSMTCLSVSYLPRLHACVFLRSGLGT